MILSILGVILFWALLVGIAFGQEVNCENPPVPVPPDCDVTLIRFAGHIVPYTVDGVQKYYISLEWYTDRGGDGYWEIMKVKFPFRFGGPKPMNWGGKLRVLKTPYFDGRWTEFAHDDYFTAKGTDVFYVLRWVCGQCDDDEFYGVVHLKIPKH